MSVLLKLREYKQLPNSENEVRMYILKNSNEVIKMSVLNNEGIDELKNKIEEIFNTNDLDFEMNL